MKRIIVILSAIAALFSCQKHEEQRLSPSNDGVIRLDCSLTHTKATSTEFETGDQISLFAVEYVSDETPELQIAGNFLNNERMSYNGSEWLSDKSLYWSTTACDFYAIYPYTDLISVDEHAFEIIADQNSAKNENTLGGYEASDLLWAKAEKKAQSDGTVGLQFRHMMSKCVVTVTKGEKFEGDIPDDIVCHIYNTTTSAKLNFAKGTVEKDAMGERKTITMKKLSNERFEAVLVPQNIERRTPLIEVTMGGIAYLLEYSLSFKPGYVHTINLILNSSPDQEKIEIAIDAEIEDMN